MESILRHCRTNSRARNPAAAAGRNAIRPKIRMTTPAPPPTSRHWLPAANASRIPQQALRSYLFRIVASRTSVHLLADVGIPPERQFGQELKHKLGAAATGAERRLSARRIRPRVSSKTDHIWVHEAPATPPERLAGCARRRGQRRRCQHQPDSAPVLEAIQMHHRISAIGLEPSWCNHPDQSSSNRRSCARMWKSAPGSTASGRRCKRRKQWRRRLPACAGVARPVPGNQHQRLRKHAQQHGVSVSLTYLLQRLKQSEQRLRTLLALMEPGDINQRRAGIAAVSRTAARRQFQIRPAQLHFRQCRTTGTKVTEHAGRTGEHYVAHDRHQYRQMLRAAMGAGLVIAVMALIKIGMAKPKRRRWSRHSLFSINYSFGFMLVHRCSFTIATKQPAMTAAHIADADHKWAAATRPQWTAWPIWQSRYSAPVRGHSRQCGGGDADCVADCPGRLLDQRQPLGHAGKSAEAAARYRPATKPGTVPCGDCRRACFSPG